MRRPMLRRHALVVLSGLLAGAGAGTAEAAEQSKGGVQLAPHRAVYDFALTKTRSASTVSALTGRMVYEFQGSRCDGFTQTSRFVTRSTAQSGEISLADQRSTTWEDPSGKRMKFQTSQYRDRKLIEQAAGTAERGNQGEDIAVTITLPEDDTTGIGGAALFPVQHTERLLEIARGGGRSFKAAYYDGSEGGTKSYLVNAFISRRKPRGHNKSLPRIAGIASLDGVASWVVSLSYYEHGSAKQDAVPAYEMSFLMFENGISRNLVIDNGDYTITGKLTKLELLEPTPCRN